MWSWQDFVLISWGHLQSSTFTAQISIGTEGLYSSWHSADICLLKQINVFLSWVQLCRVGTIWKVSSPACLNQFHNCFNVPSVLWEPVVSWKTYGSCGWGEEQLERCDANLEKAATIFSWGQGWELCFVIVLPVVIFSLPTNVGFFTTQILEAWEVWMATAQHPGPSSRN